jgi:23S rRNA (cytosine1962-C5)-methyltransferase
MKQSKNIGLDLFCYHGSWGITLLKAGLERVHFVDQGSLGTDVFQNLNLNNLQGKGDFFEQDAFKFLDQQFAKGSFYNVIVSDPPSFTKSAAKLSQAISGYKNLHTKVLLCAAKNSVVIFCSCTSYLPLDQFEETIHFAAFQTKRKIQLIDVGLQALDHPVRKLNDKSNYLKYLAYIVE